MSIKSTKHHFNKMEAGVASIAASPFKLNMGVDFLGIRH